MRIAETGYYRDCERCQRAFSSVFAANLTLLQQIIAGDSWGMVSLPIIEDAPWTVVFFFAVLITVNVGLLNLILTVIVDVANRSREADDLRKVQEKSYEFMETKKQLLTIFQELDVDASGQLSIDEMLHGFRTNPRFSTIMASLDIAADDMNIIFNMLDEDGSGLISYSEFLEQIYKIKFQDNHTMLIFLRAFLQDVQRKVSKNLEITQQQIGSRTLHLVEDMKKVLYGSLPASPTLHVNIEGAKGLHTGDSVGASDPYCICEVIGKPDVTIKSHMVEDSLDPEWQFEDDIDGFALGDALMFTVWGRDALNNDYSLGKAFLTTHDIMRSPEGFSGELQLHHSGEHLALLKVHVSSLASSSRSASEMEMELMGSTGTSLFDIGGKIQELTLLLQSELMHEIPSASIDGDVKQLTQELGTESNWPPFGEAESLKRGNSMSTDELMTQPSDWYASVSQVIAESVGRLEAETEHFAQKLKSELAAVGKDMVIKAEGRVALVQSCSSAMPSEDLAWGGDSGRGMPLACGRDPRGAAGSPDTDLQRLSRSDLCHVTRV